MSPRHVEENLIQIGGYYFRMRDLMQVTNISVPPNPVVFGDTTRASETQAMFQLIQSSYTSGTGKYYGNSRTDTERSWDSDWDQRYRDELSFPPLVTDLGIPPGASGDLSASATFLGNFFISMTDRVYALDNTTLTWLLQQVIPGQVEDMIVWRNALFVSYGTGYMRQYLGVWSDTPGMEAHLFAVWNDVLYATFWNGTVWDTMRTSASHPEMWSSSGSPAVPTSVGTFPTGVIPYQLMIYPDVNGAPSLYAFTNEGPYIFDAQNGDALLSRWLGTDASGSWTLPSGETSKAARFRDGKVYFSTGGMSMTTLQNGNPMTVGVMGLDRDDGVPADQRGKITAVASDLNWVFALVSVQNPVPSEDDVMWAFPSPPAGGDGWDYYNGPATLRAWNGGWTKLWKSDGAITTGGDMGVSTAGGIKRLFWGAGSHIYMLPLEMGIYAPRQNPTHDFQDTQPVHITPWWDYGNWTLEKVHGHIQFETENCSSTAYIDVYYGMDFSEDWYYVDRIVTNGLVDFQVAGNEGAQARFFRFKFLGRRDPLNARNAPRILFYDSEVLRVLPATYGYGCLLDIQDGVKNRSAIQQIQDLRALMDPRVTPGFYPFTYEQSVDGSPNTFYGRISRVNGQEASGAVLRGKGSYQITIVIPYSRDKV